MNEQYPINDQTEAARFVNEKHQIISWHKINQIKKSVEKWSVALPWHENGIKVSIRQVSLQRALRGQGATIKEVYFLLAICCTSNWRCVRNPSHFLLFNILQKTFKTALRKCQTEDSGEIILGGRYGFCCACHTFRVAKGCLWGPLLSFYKSSLPGSEYLGISWNPHDILSLAFL